MGDPPAGSRNTAEGINQMNAQEDRREPFFTHDSDFYKTFFSLMAVVALQNLVAYSVNMADNIMLGRYSQTALSGAATVNQIFFLVQQTTITIGDALVILASQYWGQKRTQPIRKLTGVALKLSLVCGLLILGVCLFFPDQVLGIFTSDAAIISEGRAYLNIIQHTFLLFILSHVLMSALRSVEIVNISFYISVISLIVDVCINYTLIFGKFGFPEMGVRGAGIGTFTARVVELVVVLWYMLFRDQRLRLFSENFLTGAGTLAADYRRVAAPVMASGLLWAVSVPMQTAVLGHLPGGVASDAIAANSVSSTFYQYLKVIVVAMSSASAVMIGKAIGIGNMKRVRSDARSMSVIDVCVGVVLGLILLAARQPLLNMYSLNEQALTLAGQFMYILSFVMVGMSYQMPVSSGIIRGGGDTKFSLILNMVSTWGIVMPLTFLSAFVWKWPAAAVVCVIQSDQIFKGLPILIRFRSYKWIKKLTK